MFNKNKEVSAEYREEVENLRRQLEERDLRIKELKELLQNYVQVSELPEEIYKYINIYFDKGSKQYEAIFYDDKLDALQDLSNDIKYDSPIKCVESFQWVSNRIIRSISLTQKIQDDIDLLEENDDHEMMEYNFLKRA